MHDVDQHRRCCSASCSPSPTTPFLLCIVFCASRPPRACWGRLSSSLYSSFTFPHIQLLPSQTVDLNFYNSFNLRYALRCIERSGMLLNKTVKLSPLEILPFVWFVWSTNSSGWAVRSATGNDVSLHTWHSLSTLLQDRPSPPSLNCLSTNNIFSLFLVLPFTCSCKYLTCTFHPCTLGSWTCDSLSYNPSSLGAVIPPHFFVWAEYSRVCTRPCNYPPPFLSLLTSPLASLLCLLTLNGGHTHPLHVPDPLLSLPYNLSPMHFQVRSTSRNKLLPVPTAWIGHFIPSPSFSTWHQLVRYPRNELEANRWVIVHESTLNKGCIVRNKAVRTGEEEKEKIYCTQVQSMVRSWHDLQSNKSWCIVSQGMFSLQKVNQMECKMCLYLKWQLNALSLLLSPLGFLLLLDFDLNGTPQVITWCLCQPTRWSVKFSCENTGRLDMSTRFLCEFRVNSRLKASDETIVGQEREG